MVFFQAYQMNYNIDDLKHSLMLIWYQWLCFYFCYTLKNGQWCDNLTRNEVIVMIFWQIILLLTKNLSIAYCMLMYHTSRKTLNPSSVFFSWQTSLIF